MRDKNIFDVIIIGGGPTGMFAAFYAGMRELNVKIIDTLPVLGGQVELMYPEKYIFDIGAYPYVKGKELVEKLKDQLKPFDPSLSLDEEVLDIQNEDDVFRITTAKNTHYAKSVLIAAGLGSFEPRKLKLDYPEAYEETNLHYFVSDLETYRDKEVVVLGGGDSAVDWALALEDIAQKVYVVHRRNKFRALEASVTQMKNSSIEIVTPYTPHRLIGDDEKIEAIELKERRGDDIIQIAADHFIINYGFVSDNRQLDRWGLETSRGSVQVNQDMSTNVPGIFAAGDVTAFDGKVKLIATGFGEAPTAINSIIQFLNPDEIIQAPATGDSYTTDKFKEHLDK